jgi:hypothetical protein
VRAGATDGEGGTPGEGGGSRTLERAVTEEEGYSKAGERARARVGMIAGEGETPGAGGAPRELALGHSQWPSVHQALHVCQIALRPRKGRPRGCVYD